MDPLLPASPEPERSPLLIDSREEKLQEGVP